MSDHVAAFQHAVSKSGRVRFHDAELRIVPTGAMAAFLQGELARISNLPPAQESSGDTATEILLEELSIDEPIALALTKRVALHVVRCVFNGAISLSGSSKELNFEQSSIHSDLTIELFPGDSIEHLRISNPSRQGNIFLLGKSKNGRNPSSKSRGSVGQLELKLSRMDGVLEIQNTNVSSLVLDATKHNAGLRIADSVFDKFSVTGTPADVFEIRRTTLGRPRHHAPHKESQAAVSPRVQMPAGLEISDCVVAGGADFTYLSIERQAIFDGTTFEDSADFRGFQAAGPTSFRRCILRGPLLLQHAMFTTTPDVRDISCESFTGEDLILTYRKLRQFAETSASQIDASRFFAYEQRAIRKTRAKFWSFAIDPVVSRLYDMVSEYGSSVGRATLLFFGWNAFSALLLTFSGQVQSAHTFRDVVRPGVGLALQNAVNPLALFTEKAAFLPTSTLSFVISLVQALGSVVIVALLLLALRRRFHKTSE